jgi:predicted small integral membrane protein
LFVTLFCILTVMTLLAVYRPEMDRPGVLRIATTRGDRLFLSLLSAAIIHILWIAALGASALWGATLLSLAWATGIFRYV